MLKDSLNLAPARRDHYKATVFFYWFMASLGMFFAASLLTYIIIRTQSFRPIEAEYVKLAMPLSFWLSTFLLIATSVLLERACWLVRRQKQYTNWLIAATVTATLFVVVQIFGMKYLIEQHFVATDGSTKVFGMSFVLALLHALHVIGGIVYIGYVLRGTYRGRYDHERFWAIKYCAGYWHFLDIVWFAMLITFAVAR